MGVLCTPMAKELREVVIWGVGGLAVGAFIGALLAPSGYWPVGGGLGAVVGGAVGIGIAQVRGSS